MAADRGGDVLERDLDMLALAGARAVRSAPSTPSAAICPQMQSQAGSTWATGVGRAFGAGHVGEADGGVDGVVHRRPAAGPRAIETMMRSGRRADSVS
jgi:hypothetical protein